MIAIPSSKFKVEKIFDREFEQKGQITKYYEMYILNDLSTSLMKVKISQAEAEFFKKNIGKVFDLELEIMKDGSRDNALGLKFKLQNFTIPAAVEKRA